MARISILHAGAVSAFVVLTAGAVQAQNATSVVAPFTLSWSSPATFSGATSLYAPVFTYSGTGSGSFDLGLFPSYSNLNFTAGNGMTLTSPTAPFTSLTSPVTVDFTGNGTAGEYWGASYNTPAPLTNGTQGGLVTLNFDGTTSVSYTGINYTASLYAPGDWVPGTSTGDYDLISCTETCSVVFNGTDTVFSETDTDYSGEGVTLDVTLFGGPVATPLPSTWAMLLAGFAGLGFFAYCGTKNRSAIAAA